MNEISDTYRRVKGEFVEVQQKHRDFQIKFESDFADEILRMEEQLSREREDQLKATQKPAPPDVRVQQVNLTEDPPHEPVQHVQHVQHVQADENVNVNFQVRDEEKPHTETTNRKASVHYPGTKEKIDKPAAVKLPVSKEGIKKLYRTLCKKFHPDNGAKTDATFVAIQKAYDTGNEIAMLEIGLETGMNLDVYVENKEEYIAMWKGRIEEMRCEMETLRKSIVWIWCNCSSAREREQIRENIIQHLKNKGY